MDKKQKKVRKWLIFGTLQYVFLPVLCGFITAGILSYHKLHKLGLGIFNFAHLPTIQIQDSVWTNYSGLALAAGFGCATGMIVSWFLQFGTKLGLSDFISSSTPLEATPAPTVESLVKSTVRIIIIPTIIVAAAISALKLAQTGILPGVNVDKKSRLFELTLTGVVVVAALGCLLMFLYDIILTMILRTALRRENILIELQEPE